MSIMQAGLAIVIAYILVATIIYFVQDGLLFHPTHAKHADVQHRGVQHYQFDSGSGILRGWLVNPQFIDQKLVIYYGGNAEDVYFAITDYQHLNAATLFMAYRGYGASDGKPGEKELKADALAIFDDIVERYNPRQIYLVGRSLGSGLACHTAARRTVAGTILITPYDSLVHVAKKHYPWLPVGLLMKHRFNSLADLPQISSPILVIYGGRDKVIPPPFSENLITNIRASKKVVYIEQAGHNTISSFPEYWPSIRLFIDQHGR